MVIKGQATVVKHTGSHYMLSALPQWELFPAVLRGKIRLKDSNATNPVAVGDVVNFEAEVPEGAGLEPIAEYVASHSNDGLVFETLFWYPLMSKRPP